MCSSSSRSSSSSGRSRNRSSSSSSRRRSGSGSGSGSGTGSTIDHCYSYILIPCSKYMHAYIHTYIHAYIHTYIYTYIHAYTSNTCNWKAKWNYIIYIILQYNVHQTLHGCYQVICNNFQMMTYLQHDCQFG